MKGKFITFEGCEGAGKSTQIRFLSAYLGERNIPHIVTREPGGSDISEAIRKVILDGRFTAMTDECEALLYAAARVQHLADTVAPALEAGKTVLCDRYLFSSFAYQGYGRGLSRKFLQEINSYAIGHFMPDIALFLDIPPVLAFARKHGADKEDRIEQAGEAVLALDEGDLVLAQGEDGVLYLFKVDTKEVYSDGTAAFTPDQNVSLSEFYETLNVSMDLDLEDAQLAQGANTPQTMMEIIDVDAYTGGFNLQIAFSTGYAAGNSIR